MKLWIDDERPLPPGWTDHYAIAQSSAQAIALLSKWRDSDETVQIVSFDHDLGLLPDGSDDTSRRVLTWMIENDYWPLEMRFHTANPIGRQWLLGTARTYAPGWVNVAV